MDASLWESIPQQLKAAVFGVIGTVLTRMLVQYLQPKPRIAWAKTHQFAFHIRNVTTPYAVFTETVFVQNTGRKTATDIELHFISEPKNFQVWPALSYEKDKNPEGQFVLRIKNLGPKEYFTVEILQVTEPPPLLLRVRSPLGEARQVPMAPMRVFSWRVNMLLIGLMFFGIFSIVYFIALALLP